MPLPNAKVRRATADDIPEIVAIANAAIDEERWFTREPGQYHDPNHYGPAIQDGDKAVFVATIADDVIGHIFLSSREAGGPVYLGMIVRRDLRHQGIGGLLLDAAIQWAREQGLRELRLSVYSHNAAGIALYRRKGFREIEYRPAHLTRNSGEIWDLVFMVCDLNNVVDETSA